MKSKLHEYQGKDLLIRYDQHRCIHVGECVKRLPAVFDPKRTPWVVADAASAAEVITAVAHCPTGALSVESLDETLPIAPANTVRLSAEGPVFLSGRVEIRDHNNHLLLEDRNVALCRCGASENRPLCDGRHSVVHFDDPGAVTTPPSPTDAGEDQDNLLVVTIVQHGPALLNGPFQLVDAFGDLVCKTSKAALCRCGQSKNKPFCDGSHNTSGFRDEAAP